MLLTLLMLPLAAQGADKPATFPTESYDREIGIRATLNGKEVGFALKPFWPDSYLTGGSEKSVRVLLGDKPLAAVKLKALPKDEMPEGADGVLGQDALRQATLVFDIVRHEVRVVAQTKISTERAGSLLSDLPSWGGLSRVVKIPLKRTADGVPTVAALIGGEAATLMLRLSFSDSVLDSSVNRPPESVSENDWSYLAKADLGGFVCPLVPYAPHEAWALPEEKEGAGGMVALDAFRSRRVIVDLAGDAVYVESLPDEARLSLALSRETDLPLLIEGDNLVVGTVPGEEDDAPPPYPKGAEVRSIAGVAAKEWLDDLRAGTDEAAGRMAKRVLLLDRDYPLVVRGADGKDVTFTVPRDPAPAPLRAGGRTAR